MSESGELLLINLEDFPHGDLIGHKEGENGPIDFYHALPGTKVVAVDEKTGELSWQAVYGWSKHYQREVEIVTLASGRQIFTDHDPRAVYGIKKGALEFGRATPSDALAGEYLVPRAQKLSSLHCEDSSEAEAASGLRSFEAGYVFGTMAANGWVESHNNTLTGRFFIATLSEEVGGRFLDFSEKLFDIKNKRMEYSRGADPKNAYGESKKWGFSSKEAAETFQAAIGEGARQKHLPPWFLSSPAAFRKGLFAGLMDNDGSISISNGKNKPQLMASYTTSSVRLAQEVQMLANSLNIRSRITATKTPLGKDFWACTFSNVDISKWGGEGMVNATKAAKLGECAVVENSPVLAKYDIVPISFALATAITKALGAPRYGDVQKKTLYTLFSKSKTSGSISRISARKLPDWLTPEELERLPDWAAWWAIVKAEDITWDRVESVEKTGIREDGYDLTVPGYETFMNIDGVILSNTMSVHVPISHDANREAEKMLPSRNLYQPGTGRLMVAPAQEAQIGLYYLSQTDKGRERIAQIVGKKHMPSGPLDKKVTVDILTKLSKELPPQQWAKAVQELKKIGEDHALATGFTLGLNDVHDMAGARDKIVAVAADAAKKAKNQDELDKINTWAQMSLDKQLREKLDGKKNPLYDMVHSGARGDKSQLRSMLAAPLFMADQKNRIIATPVRKSYAEGLSPSDYWIASYGARRGAVERSVQSSLPGAFSKDVMSTVLDNVVAKDDCGTHEGITESISDQSALDRYTAGPQAGFAHNTLVTAAVLNEFKKRGINTVKVRSPLTCDLDKGTCAHCHGLDEHGGRPDVGSNIGVKAGQTISEPLVQMSMNTRHTGGVAGTGTSAYVGGFARIGQLLRLPDTLHGAAALAPAEGKVTKIEKGLAGGYNVFVGNVSAFAPSGSQLVVKVGDSVHRGDRLSTGPIRPQELAELKGMQAAQKYISDELHKEYHAQGSPIHKKVFETVVRSLGNVTRITGGGGLGHLPGDVISLTAANNYNKNLLVKMPVEDAEGHELAENTRAFTKGHVLTEKDCKAFAANGIKEVLVKREPLVHAPFLKSMTEVAAMKGDWMAPLGYRYITRSIVEGASTGKKSDTAGYHPVPALAHASTFGQGKDGKY
jgi:hypothetical protein